MSYRHLPKAIRMLIAETLLIQSIALLVVALIADTVSERLRVQQHRNQVKYLPLHSLHSLEEK